MNSPIGGPIAAKTNGAKFSLSELTAIVCWSLASMLACLMVDTVPGPGVLQAPSTRYGT